MSHHSPYSFIQRTFPPMVGALTSPSVDQICQKNNLSFVELLRPFSVVSLEQRLRDPSGNDHLIKSLQISIQDVKDRPPQPTLARKYLNESVCNASCDVTKVVEAGSTAVDVPTDCPWFRAWCETFLQVQFPSDHEFTKHLLGCLLVVSTVDPPETLQELLQSLQQMQATAPERLPKWFSPDIFKYFVVVHDSRDFDRAKAVDFYNSIKSAYGPDHCFLLEINSNLQHEPSTLGTDYWMHVVVRRNQELDGSDHGSSPRTPAEIMSIGGMPSTLASDPAGVDRAEVAQEAGEVTVPIVLHPLSPDIEINHFSANNDRDRLVHMTSSSEVHKVVNMNVWSSSSVGLQLGHCLSTSDITNIRSLVKHLVTQALFPHVEKQIFLLTDLVSTKKGVSRSLLTATRRLFGSSKPGLPSATLPNSVIYAVDAPELQLRRLGDLHFMFTNYLQAFQAYHSAKRDFGADQAWLYYAGSLEMAALAAFMQGDTSKKALEYMEDAIMTYLNSCKMPQFATRATLLSTECLRDRQLFGEAAKQLIRMTSEDSDLRSGLLLEQASYCFLYSLKPQMFRKYAFHMVLAGHRFSKAGQKKHALRCYKQAFQVYQEHGWRLAEDHVHFTIGRLAGSLRLLKEACSSFGALLTSGSKQTPSQQVTYLREYLQLLQQSQADDASKGLTVLPLPVFEDNSARVLVACAAAEADMTRAFQPDSPADSVRWSRMEELAVTEAQGTPMIFKPTVNLYSGQTLNTGQPIVVVNEAVHVQFTVRNTLQISLPLRDLRLLWSFKATEDRAITNEEPTTVSESLVNTTVLDSVDLEPNCLHQVTLSLVPLCSGELTILGVYYKLTCPALQDSLPSATPSPQVAGKQVLHVRGPKTKPGKDQTHSIYAEDRRLNMKIVPAAPLLQVQTTPLKSDLLCGEVDALQVTLRNCGNAALKTLYLATSCPHLITLSPTAVLSEKVVEDSSPISPVDGNPCYQVVKISLDRMEVLNPGQHLVLSMWIRAPDRRGPGDVAVLFYYENALGNIMPRHRVCRFSFPMTVHDCVQLKATPTRSFASDVDAETINISVSVKNLCQPYSALNVDLSLVQASLASSQWRAIGRPVYTEGVALHSQEVMFLLLRAQRTDARASQVSDVRLIRDDPSVVVAAGASHPYSDYHRWHVLRDKNRHGAASSSLIGLVLCLHWQADVTDSSNVTGKVTGVHHVILTQLGVTVASSPDLPEAGKPLNHVRPAQIFGVERRSSSSAAAAAGRPLQLDNAVAYGLVYPYEGIPHCFQHTRICKVDMTLVMRNCLDQPVQVTVNAAGVKPSRPSSKTQLYTPFSSTAFSWTCRGSMSVTLQPLTSTSLPVSAAFTSPGTYDLTSRLVVSASSCRDPSTSVVQTCRPDASVVIVNKIS